ncbi:MAG: ATP-binding protein [Symploca sp. SIO2C1]|nr:ATP-binding protein [Symploca sp. SIO2C1]
MSFSIKHIDYIERNFVESQRTIDAAKLHWLSCQRLPSKLVGIKSLPGVDVINQRNFPRNTLIQRMEDLLTGAYGVGQSVIYGIIGDAQNIRLLATAFIYSHSGFQNSSTSENIINSLFQSAYPGIELQAQSTLSSLFNPSYLPYMGVVTGTPTLTNSTPLESNQIDRLIQALYGKQWAYVVVAHPFNASDFQSLSLDTLAELEHINNTEQSANLRQPRPINEKYRNLLENFWDKLQTGKSNGLWQSIGYIFASDSSTLSHAQATVKAIFSGAKSLPDPIRVLSAGQISKDISALSQQSLVAIQGPGKIQYPTPFLNLLNSSELAAMVHLPTREMPGFFVHPQAYFDLSPHTLPTSDPTIQIGDVLNQQTSTGRPYEIDLKALTRHTLITGTIGSGKTNTIFHLLKQLESRKIPFLVIEPAKTEYRALLKSSVLQDKLQIFTLGDETVSPFRLNPFEILPGVSVQTHIDHLKSVFNASFAMFAPLPEILERCLYEIYEDKGWDPVTGENPRGLLSSEDSIQMHPGAYPTLSDLYEKVDAVVSQARYHDEVERNIKGALKTRIDSLRIGGKGLMLDTPISIPIQKLLEKPTILELDAVGDDREKAFLIGLVLMSIYEHYRAKGLSEGTSLQHITVVEEAHRILKDTSGISRLDIANMAGKAVEDFSQILAEIRAYGEGIVIAEQIPSKLSSDIIKLTNLKIAHRVISADDHQILAGSMVMNTEQTRWIASCATGEAAVFGEGDDNPLRLRIPYQKELGVVRAENIRTSMAQFQADNTLLFCRFFWSPIEARLVQKYLRDAQRIANNPEFQEVLRQYLISGIIDPMLFQSGLPILTQIVRKISHQPDLSNLLPVTLTLSIHQLFEALGDKFHVSYEIIATIKRQFIELLLKLLPMNERLDPNSYEQVDVFDKIANFQKNFRKLFFGNYFPYSGCEKVCSNNICAYRHYVSPLVKDDRLRKNFTNESNNAEWEKLREVCGMATRRVLLTPNVFSSSKIPASEQRKVGLCFAIQMGEVLPDLDEHLRGNLLNGLLPYMQQD